MEINGKYEHWIRPIISAINADAPKTLEFVIEHGADVNFDQGGPLYEAIDCCIDGMIQNNRKKPYTQSLEMVNILLNNGADIESKNANGERPIDVTCSYAQNSDSHNRLKSFFRPLIPNIDELL